MPHVTKALMLKDGLLAFDPEDAVHLFEQLKGVKDEVIAIEIKDDHFNVMIRNLVIPITERFMKPLADAPKIFVQGVGEDGYELVPVLEVEMAPASLHEAKGAFLYRQGLGKST